MKRKYFPCLLYFSLLISLAGCGRKTAACEKATRNYYTHNIEVTRRIKDNIQYLKDTYKRPITFSHFNKNEVHFNITDRDYTYNVYFTIDGKLIPKMPDSLDTTPPVADSIMVDPAFKQLITDIGHSDYVAVEYDYDDIFMAYCLTDKVTTHSHHMGIVYTNKPQPDDSNIAPGAYIRMALVLTE